MSLTFVNPTASLHVHTYNEELISVYSISPVHSDAKTCQICGPAHKLVRQDEQKEAKGETKCTSPTHKLNKSLKYLADYEISVFDLI